MTLTGGVSSLNTSSYPIDVVTGFSFDSTSWVRNAPIDLSIDLRYRSNGFLGYRVVMVKVDVRTFLTILKDF